MCQLDKFKHYNITYVYSVYSVCTSKQIFYYVTVFSLTLLFPVALQDINDLHDTDTV